MLDRVIAFFTSLKLTVVCLTFGMLLVFAGTLAQVEMGLYEVQRQFFQSYFVLWKLPALGWHVPLPGGYLVGGLLLINLVASHFARFSLSWNKAGIWLVHFGLILLLIGQLMTDLLSRESTLHLREGQTKNYSESGREAELVLTDKSDPKLDKVVSIPQRLLMSRSEITHPDLPFTLKVKNFYPNSVVQNRPANATEPPPATQGIGLRASVQEVPKVTTTDRRDVPSMIFEVVSKNGQSLGTWLASEYVNDPQPFRADDRSWEVSMRLRRYYKPFSLQLVEFRHDLYPGTQIPKNFSSRVVLNRPETGEQREVLIKMNRPLRYEGETFYQSSFDPDNEGTILQVVRNPGWLTPYFSCVLVGLGLLLQFFQQLFGFTLKRRTT